jgi:myo-inositol catabolism protein IolS
MRYRKLGKTGWKVSAVSMGCWGIGGQWGEVSEKQALATIKAALDAGVNLFDTADAYGMGQSERFVGKAFRRRPDDVYIATKVGNWGRRMGDPLSFKTIWSVMECCDASLYRMGMDVIDLYQCHIGIPEHPEIFVEAFERLKEQGKIRHYAISTNDLASLKALNATGGCASCQMEYSILRRAPEKELLPYCLENDVGVLLRGPLTKGILADKFDESTRFDDSVRKGWNEGADRERFLRDVRTVAKLRPALRRGQGMVELALQFVLAHAAVTCPIPGMKNPDQARSNAAAADGELTPEQKSLIDEVSPPPA